MRAVDFERHSSKKTNKLLNRDKTTTKNRDRGKKGKGETKLQDREFPNIFKY